MGRVVERARREVRRGWKKTRKGARRATSFARTRPTVVMLGGRRCGTTSLYEHLVRHPQILGAWRKEPHYWDFAWRRGEGYYRLFFPFELTSRARRAEGLEATTYYIFNP